MLREQMWPGSNVVRGDDSNQSPNGAYEWRAIRREDNGEMFQFLQYMECYGSRRSRQRSFHPEGEAHHKIREGFKWFETGGARSRS